MWQGSPEIHKDSHIHTKATQSDMSGLTTKQAAAITALLEGNKRAGVPSGAAWAGAGYLAFGRGVVPGVAQQEV